MDAGALTPARERELASLRGRAYGPDADIDEDPAALARLGELEALVRSANVPPAPGDLVELSRDVVEEPVAAATDVEATTVARGGEETTTAPAQVATAPPRARPWWRRVPVWAFVAVGAIVLSTAVAVPALLPPRPDAVLPVVAAGDPDQFVPREMLDWYSVDLATLQRHEDFHGMMLWTATDTRGSRCILLSFDSSWADVQCAPAPMDPIVQMVIYQGMPQFEGLELPNGSVVRFTRSGDAIDVQIGEVDATA